MSAPLIGKRVVIEAVSSKPELNGQQGTCISFDESKARYSVELTGNRVVSLKPSNLRLVDGGSEGSPGGIPTDFNSLLQRLGLSAAWESLQSRIPPAMAPYTNWLPFLLLGSYLLGGVQLVGLLAAGLAGVMYAENAGMLDSLAAKLEGALLKYSGRPVSRQQAKCIVVGAGCLLVYIGWMKVAGGSPSVHRDASYHQDDDPYQQGYNDARAGKPRRYQPGAWSPQYNTPTPPAASSSRWGMGKMINMMILGNYVKQLGGSPFSLGNVATNFQHLGMMQKMMILMMASGFIW